MLFNVYVHDALSSNQLLSQLLRRDDLRAYADDIVIRLSSRGECLRVLEEFKKLEEKWGLKINLTKSEILAFDDSVPIGGIACKRKVRYLGMTISVDRTETKAIAEKDMKRNLRYLQGRLRSCSVQVKE